MTAPRPPFRQHRFSYEAKIVLNAALCALPGFVLCALLMLAYDSEWEVWVTVMIFLILPWPLLAWRLQSRISNPIKIATNILGSIREGDYTMRTKRIGEKDGTIVELYKEINYISELLEHSRTAGIETQSAIVKIMEHIDVAILVVDQNRVVKQANDAARRLIASITNWEASPIDCSVDELRIAFCLDDSPSDFSRFSYRDASRRFEGRRGIFRMEGQRYSLILLTDITQASSEQERESWKRLLRVLGHELNNSLAPISSLANTLHKITRATEMDSETKTDLLDGMETIATRSEDIVRFMKDYTQLARLPEPNVRAVSISHVLRKVCQLYSEEVQLDLPSTSPYALADPSQIEQAMINLVKNACEATSHRAKSVRVSTRSSEESVAISIEDEGPGISNPDNLFVPFYTTKENGSGIGLAISKQIVEAVGGSLSLKNRTDRQGCIASITLKRA
ncbi:ATP-binding protein [Pelagicoccus sp. SDUM812003]|uniref:sensor histidine kinase n=1 Tax=Pelagicoccus sp. SDUM812003 TaxID=3041267 RepID=UPI00280CA486|nr:ATP-binding protein [Pelagicoccus sp. SDUM812003]MDQ8202745.1 ATP-binding protein [Pelagicoccus sp. SDUM812003]